MSFESLSNELILCIWDHLLAADAIFSFSNLNNRFTSLLYEHCGLYRKLDLRYCSLSICRYFCHQAVNMDDWRRGLTVLKLGNLHRCCQVNMFADEAVKSFITEKEQQHAYGENSLCHSFITNNNYRQPMFPQLVSLVVFESTRFSDTCRDTLLYLVAGGSALRTFVCRAFSEQTHHSKAFFDWLFQHSHNLHSYHFTVRSNVSSQFELTCEHTLSNNYIPHQSLRNLEISLETLLTLHVLLHYLPQLEHLSASVSTIITSTDSTDRLPIKLNYPKNLRTLKLKKFFVQGQDICLVEEFVEKFHNTLEILHFYTKHSCEDDFNLCFNGHRLARLCEKLSRLQEISFTIILHFIGIPNHDLVPEIRNTFCTPFWLYGPLGHIRVCVNHRSIWDVIQIFSLPYKYPDHLIIHTTDLLSVQFNDSKEDKQLVPQDLCNALQPLWYNMRRLHLYFNEKQHIPLSFLQALQCPFRSHGKRLMIFSQKGIIPSNAENDVQLVHFTELLIDAQTNTDPNYDPQSLYSWFRLLPNIAVLNVGLVELKYWFRNELYNEQLNSFLRRLTRLTLHCSCIITHEMNEEIMEPLLLFLFDPNRFSKLNRLQFVCRNISSSWKSIDRWIEFILNRIVQHRLTCVRFDFEKVEEEIETSLQTGDEIIIINELPYVIDVHRFVSKDHVLLWIERRERNRCN